MDNSCFPYFLFGSLCCKIEPLSLFVWHDCCVGFHMNFFKFSLRRLISVLITWQFIFQKFKTDKLKFLTNILK